MGSLARQGAQRFGGIGRPVPKDGGRAAAEAPQARIGRGAEAIGERRTARQRAERRPGPLIGVAVEAHRLNVWGTGRGEGDEAGLAAVTVAARTPIRGREDAQLAAARQPHRRPPEERTADRQHVGAGDLRVEAERPEHVPGRERAEVVVAGIAVRGGVVEPQRPPHDGLGLVGLPRPVIQPGDVQVGLVAEQRVIGVGRAGTAVKRAQETVEPVTAAARPPIAAKRPAGFWGTSQVYWVESPSAKPAPWRLS